MKVLGVVTARAGSKGLPGKNTRPLGGKPLIAYTIDAAQQSQAFDRLILSTDDPQSIAIARGRGCEVPFERPAALCADDTPHLPVMQHAVDWLRDHDAYVADWVMILLPTSPFRQPRHIRESIALGNSAGADSVVGVDELPAHFHPSRTVTVDADGWTRLFVGNAPVRQRPGRRQDMPTAWVLNGAIYLFRSALLLGASEPSLYGDRVQAYAMEHPYGFNIDDERDWLEAERLVSAGMVS